MMLLPWIAAAAAESREDGTSGGIVAPTAEVLPRGRTAVAIGASAAATSAGDDYGILPFGVGYSYGKNTELGFLVGVEGVSLRDPEFSGTELGLRLRQRVSGGANKGLPVVLEAGGRGFTGDWSAELGAALGLQLGGLQLHPALSARWSQAGGFGGGATLVAAHYLLSSLRVVSEVELRAGETGLESLSGRAGLRLPIAKRVHVMAWGGGGLRGGAGWGGGGATLLLYALDPRDVDRDADQIGDWKDRCPDDVEDVDKFEDYDGCPDPDNDGDGIPDARDETPNGESATPLQYSESTPLLRMRIHERGLPGDDPDAP